MEHTYDPWYVLKKFSKYLAPGGKLVVQTPNVQCWETIYRLLSGDFPYVSGGTWDYSHIRWYTLKSWIDIGFVAGFNVISMLPQIAGNPDLSHLEKRKEIKTLRLPPPETKSNYQPIDIVMPVDIKPIYNLFLAHAFVLLLEKDRDPEDYDPTPAGGYLESYRLNTPNFLADIAALAAHPIVPSSFSTVRKKAVTVAETLKMKAGKKE
ncbi:hypothetical protein JCM14722_08350 [Pseudodesulfovibrio portus]|uniref:Uncharacterized protein n=2 Tax=Pseudodesulfovibrio portus TaxID=231439 RepID=A0ABM8API9_9BACT|nr:hypothetical protein JCM14722_08350 [Pseudodesulfovibrio portus]